MVDILHEVFSGALSGIDHIGELPTCDAPNRLLILYYKTQTERDLLQEFYDQLAKSDAIDALPKTAWVWEDSTSDQLAHTDLSNQLGVDGATEIVPIGVAWKPRSSLRQSWWQIAMWMRLVDSNAKQKNILKKNPTRCAIVIGEAGSRTALQARYIKQPQYSAIDDAQDHARFADFVALQAALTVERDARAVTGTTVKYPRFVIRSIWARPDFQTRLLKIANETGRDIAEVQSVARECLEELIPKVRAPHVSFSTVFARYVCRLGYEEKLVYDQDKMQEIAKIARTKPTALVWTHKTHIDGLAMMMASRDESFPLVHIIGGNNMAFLGLGYLMRRAGTVFIRRKMDDPIYKAVLRFYLSYLLEKRFPVSWALEGTRSRNGKLMSPRFGILKYVVEAAASDQTKDLTIIPISIYYDLIAELGDYATEQTGAKKRKESLAWFTDYLRSLRKPLGRISLGLGEPVTVDTTSPEFVAAIDGDPGKFSVELQKIAFRASVNANDVTPLTPSSVFALALTGASPRALTEQELEDEVTKIRNWALSRNILATDELKQDGATRTGDIANSMIEMGVISKFTGGPQAVYSIADGRHFEASYYRNNAIHVFVNKAIVELALAKATEALPNDAIAVFEKELEHIRDCFKFEFFYPPAKQHHAELIAELERTEPNWRAKLAAGEAENLLRGSSPIICHAVLRPFTEAYLVIADVLLENEAPEDFNENTVVANALKLGKQAHLQRRITSEESIGKLMFSNGYKLAENRGLVNGGSQENRAVRLAFAREIQDLAQRLWRVSDIAAQTRVQKSWGMTDTPSHLSVVGDE